MSLRLQRGLATAVLAAASGLANAGSTVLSPGSSLTTGSASNPFSVYGAHINPAAGDSLIAEDERWRMNLLPSVSLGLEVGPVDNFVDDLDELIDLLDDPSLSDESVDDTLNRFNATLTAAGEHGYVRADTIVSAPLFPLHWRPEFIAGSFSAELNIMGQAHLSVLDDELAYDPQNQSFTTGTAAYLKSGLQQAFSLGYSRPLLETGGDGQLYLGVKLNAYRLELSKQVSLLQLLDGRDTEDLIRDEYDRNVHSSMGVGVDLGLLWQSARFSSGITLANINEPSFDFGSVGTHCSARPENTDERSNCEAAAVFASAGELKLHETHTKHAVATLENSVLLTPRWLLTTAVDLADYNDMVGDEHQWASAGTAYYPKSLWIPAVRAGYRQNLTGSELSSVTAGISLFGSLTLDLEWGLEDVTIDNETGPRRLGFALGFEERF